MPPDDTRWLTVQEVCVLLRVSPNNVRSMLRRGELVGVTVKSGHFRVMHPGDRFTDYFLRQQAKESDRLDYAPLLTSHEVGILLGIDLITVRRHTMKGRLHGQMVGQRRMYSIEEVRKFLFDREKRVRKGKKYYSERLLQWARTRIYNDNPEISEVVEDILRLPEPERSLRLEQLFAAAEELAPLTALAKKLRPLPSPTTQP